MQTITLKMEEGLVKAIDCSLKPNRYSTRTEFVRDAVRSKLTALEKEKLLKTLIELRGSMKGKAKMTDEKAKEIAFAEIAKKLNVPLD